MWSDPVDPGGEVRSSPMVCTIGMWKIAPLLLVVVAGMYMEFLEMLKTFFTLVCCGCGVRQIFWHYDWHRILILFPLHCM